jgi:hypothetical protein
MTPHPKIRLSRLRDIGWTLWDPIGLMADGSDWQTAGFADEYDSYLLRAAGMVRNGAPLLAVVEYLIGSETVHMGLSPAPGMRARAEAVVRAIQADDQLWSEGA